MDILSEKGQQSVLDEELAALIWESVYPRSRYIHTPKNRPAAIDAVIIDSNSQIKAVVETKCRYDMGLEEFQNARESEWLVTYIKIVKAVQVADMLCVPLVGFLYLVPDKVLLYQTIYDQQYVVKMRIDQTRTQETINGGEIVRSNAYIDMSAAKVITKNEP